MVIGNDEQLCSVDSIYQMFLDESQRDTFSYDNRDTSVITEALP